MDLPLALSVRVQLMSAVRESMSERAANIAIQTELPGHTVAIPLTETLLLPAGMVTSSALPLTRAVSPRYTVPFMSLIITSLLLLSTPMTTLPLRERAPARLIEVMLNVLRLKLKAESKVIRISCLNFVLLVAPVLIRHIQDSKFRKIVRYFLILKVI